MLRGIDISSWQTGISIPDIARECCFLIAKCTESVSFKDEPFESFMQQGYDNDMLLGMYHYARPNINASIQAEYFYANSKNWIGKAIPFLDMEEDFSDWESFATEFMDAYENLAGIRPILYCSNAQADYFSESFAKKNPKVWLAEYWKPFNHYPTFASFPNCSPWDTFFIWQFSSSGQLDGFNGNLDLDYFNGSKDDWISYIGGSEMISEADKKDIARMCAEYVYGDSDKKANLNMYNATHWGFSYAKKCYNLLFKIAEKIGAN